MKGGMRFFKMMMKTGWDKDGGSHERGRRGRREGDLKGVLWGKGRIEGQEGGENGRDEKGTGKGDWGKDEK